ncbi:MAG: hypothetical protein JF887_00545 [Candidatus Dormibacteraeota bacterium]|uniref:Glyoxalase-like domain-containing protein n=1 Tax=Candidatus Amunia macphersoniae TaxID=3127014 RepID=A0A934KJM0_9BACT|nr:hypothetical protein [Candidatus Dormibacteraeota bacterium]
MDHAAFVAELLAQGRIPDQSTAEVDGGRQFADVSACRDPQGVHPRLFFQRVPEGKVVKNRVHLDIHVGKDRIDEEVARLVALEPRPRGRPTTAGRG